MTINIQELWGEPVEPNWARETRRALESSFCTEASDLPGEEGVRMVNCIHQEDQEDTNLKVAFLPTKPLPGHHLETLVSVSTSLENCKLRDIYHVQLDPQFVCWSFLFLDFSVYLTVCVQKFFNLDWNIWVPVLAFNQNIWKHFLWSSCVWQ